MEDLVAVEVSTTRGAKCYFLTWGRVQDSVDPEPLARLIIDVADRFALPGRPTAARVCDTLREAREAPLFYEALFDFAQHPIPFGSDFDAWRFRTDSLMREGKEIYYLGSPTPGAR